MDLAAACRELARCALAIDAGDPDGDASAEATALLSQLADDTREDAELSVQLLRFLTELSTVHPKAGAFKSLFGAVALDTAPRLLALGAASPAAAAAAVLFVEQVLAAPGCCSARELVMVVTELYDTHKDSAFHCPMQLLLLRLLRGTLPRLVAAVQRRRLQVALSCLQAVADLAAAAGRRLQEVARAGEAMQASSVAAAAAAAAVAAAAAATGAGGDAANGQEVAAAAGGPGLGSGDEEAREAVAAAAAALVAPFADFAEQLHARVLAAELPPVSAATAPIASGTSVAAAAAAATAAAEAGGGGRDRPKVAAWLLALLGALWPAWGPAPGLGFADVVGSGGGGSGGNCAGGGAAETAAARLAAMLPQYLPAAAAMAAPNGGGDGDGRGGGGGAVTWAALRAAAQAAGPLPGPSEEAAEEGSDEEAEEEEGATAGPEEWVLSEPALAHSGAALLLWLDLTRVEHPAAAAAAAAAVAVAAAARPLGTSSGGSGGRGGAVGGTGGSDGAASRLPSGLLPLQPPADPEEALAVLLELLVAQLGAAQAGGHPELLGRALQMMAAAGPRMQHIRKAAAAAAAAAERGAAEGTSRVSASAAAAGTSDSTASVPTAAEALRSWAAVAERLTATASPGAHTPPAAATTDAAATADAAAATDAAATADAAAAPHPASPPLRGVTTGWQLLHDALHGGVNIQEGVAAAAAAPRAVAAAAVDADSWAATAAAPPPPLSRFEASLRPAAARVATAAAVNISCAPSESGRRLAHNALQSLLTALTPALRAHVLWELAHGPSPEASSVVVQRLQREIGAAAAAASTAAAVTAFAGAWVLGPVLHQLRSLQVPLPQPLPAAVAASGSGAAGEAVVVTPATALPTAAAMAEGADAATAALSVVRFLALRHGRAAAGHNDPRVIVLREFNRLAVEPLRPVVRQALQELQRQVVTAAGDDAAVCVYDAGLATAAAAEAAAAVQAAAVTAAAAAGGDDRFAGNVAVVGPAVTALVSVSRLSEVMDYLEELL